MEKGSVEFKEKDGTSVNLEEGDAAIIFRHNLDKDDSNIDLVIRKGLSQFSSTAQTAAITLFCLMMENNPMLDALLESKNKEISRHMTDPSIFTSDN